MMTKTRKIIITKDRKSLSGGHIAAQKRKEQVPVGNRSSLFVNKFIIKKKTNVPAAPGLAKRKYVIPAKKRSPKASKRQEQTPKRQRTFRDELGRVRGNEDGDNAPDFFKINQMFCKEDQAPENEESVDEFDNAAVNRGVFNKKYSQRKGQSKRDKQNFNRSKPRNLSKPKLKQRVELEEARLGRRLLPRRNRSGPSNLPKNRRLRSSFRYKKMLTVKRKFEEEDADANIININSLAGLKSFEEELNTIQQFKEDKPACHLEKISEAPKLLANKKIQKEKPKAVFPMNSSVDESAANTLFNNLRNTGSCGIESDDTRRLDSNGQVLEARFGRRHSFQSKEDLVANTSKPDERNTCIEPVEAGQANPFERRDQNNFANQANVANDTQHDIQTNTQHTFQCKADFTNLERHNVADLVNNENSKTYNVNVFKASPGDGPENAEKVTPQLEYLSPFKLKKSQLGQGNLGQEVEDSNPSLNLDDWEQDIFAKLTPSKNFLRAGSNTPNKSRFGSAKKR